MKSRDVILTQFLSLATTKYGVNPLFDIIVDAFRRIGVSHYKFYNTNVFLCIYLVSECAKVSDLKQIQVDLPIIIYNYIPLVWYHFHFSSVAYRLLVVLYNDFLSQNLTRWGGRKWCYSLISNITNFCFLNKVLLTCQHGFF